MSRLAPKPKTSAGLLMYRVVDGELQVLIGHPGGPFWRDRDEGAWSIPKGELDQGEDALAAAQREFYEETGFESHGPFIELAPITQRSGKVVRAWAFTGDCDPVALKSNTCEVEWPPRSGRRIEVPELDRVAFFSVPEARRKLNPAQVALVEELQAKIPARH